MSAKPTIFIDGEAGTTGLQIRDRLKGRTDLDLLSIAPERRKDASARRDLLNSADVAILCLPDEAAVEAVSLIDKGSRTLPALRASGRFVVNFMRHDCADVCRLFASRADDKFEQVSWRAGEGGVPVLHEGTVAHAECTVLQELEIGDHIVLTGLVHAGARPDPGDVPIVYYRRGFSPVAPAV